MVLHKYLMLKNSWRMMSNLCKIHYYKLKEQVQKYKSFIKLVFTKMLHLHI